MVRHLASRNVWVVIVVRILKRMMRHGVGKVSIVVGVIRTGVSKSPGVNPSTIIIWIIPWIIQTMSGAGSGCSFGGYSASKTKRCKQKNEDQSRRCHGVFLNRREIPHDTLPGQKCGDAINALHYLYVVSLKKY